MSGALGSGNRQDNRATGPLDGQQRAQLPRAGFPSIIRDAFASDRRLAISPRARSSEAAASWRAIATCANVRRRSPAIAV
jgi:hypothetical protein